MRRRGAAALIALALAPALARAAPPDGTSAPRMKARTLDDALAVEPGATCLDRARLLADVRGWLDHDRVDPRVAIRVRGSANDPHALRFVVWVGDEVAVERTFEAAPDDCAELHAVVSLAVAIALDDALPAELGIVPAKQVAAGESDLPSFTDEDPRTPTPRRKVALALTLAAGVFAWVTPRLSGGAVLSFDIRPLDHFDLRFGALVTHLPNFALDVGAVDVSVALGRFDLCWGTQPRRVRARLCAGAAGGAAVSVADGFTNNFRRTTPYFAGLVGADLSVRLIGPLALELRVDGVLPFQRTVLDVRSTSGQLLARERFAPAGLVVAVGPRFEFR